MFFNPKRGFCHNGVDLGGKTTLKSAMFKNVTVWFISATLGVAIPPVVHSKNSEFTHPACL